MRPPARRRQRQAARKRTGGDLLPEIAARGDSLDLTKGDGWSVSVVTDVRDPTPLGRRAAADPAWVHRVDSPWTGLQQNKPRPQRSASPSRKPSVYR